MQRSPVASIAIFALLLTACGSEQTSGEVPAAETETEDTDTAETEVTEDTETEAAEGEAGEAEEPTGDAPPGVGHTARYEEQYENECDACRMVEATPTGPDAPELGRHSPPHGAGCMRPYTRIDTNPPHSTMRACPDHCCEE
jgi:hypothetical protein